MNVYFTPRGWAEYHGWRTADPKLFNKATELIDDVVRSPFKGLGKPEPLVGPRQGWWPRRISEEHRLVYRIAGSGADQRIEVAQCRGHY